ncbi:MAG: hypothetical protein M5U09_04090 [Gammaproteobacteria bacterium]|nr:hypothetical protein [Gammaproteobacteria bacterium]
MKQETTRLTFRLPRQRLEFPGSHASAHDMTVAELIGRYLGVLQSMETRAVAPEVEAIAGLVPADVEAENEYREHVTRRD